MKKLPLTLAALSLATSTAFVSTTAFAEVSANVSATSNYLWRGLEQTSGDAAISGGIDYSAESGFYAGTWVSNAWGGTELDLYGGYGADINESMSYDVGFIYYAYPDIDDVDFSEVYANFTFTGLTLGVAVLTSAEDYDAGDSIYASADYALALSNGAEVGFHVGSYSGDAVDGWYGESAIDFGVSLSKDNFTFGVSKTDYEDGLNSDDMKFYVSYSVDISL
ncbi:MAG: TorF family putative porin [Colwellia sp.]